MMAISSSTVSMDSVDFADSSRDVALGRDELLSAACDGEVDSAQMDAFLVNLRTDVPDAHGGSQRRSWNTNHLIGDALRMGEPPLLSGAFQARFAAALEREPTILAPGAVGPRVAPRAVPQASLFRKPLWMGFSVAASVAAVAFVGYGAVSVWRGADSAAPQLAKSPPLAPAVVASSPAALVPAAEVVATAPDVPNEYLVAHRQLSGGRALQGYTRAAFPDSGSGGQK